MKNMIESVIVAFSMYSKLPMPHIEWNDKNMKYAICYFPLIGLAEGILMCLWYLAARHLGLGDGMRGALMCALPIFVTGGIHMDGFLDTSDAINSWKSMEEKLEIMKDSHAGAFAIICGLTYFVLFFGACCDITGEDLPVLCLLPVLSRSLSGLALVKFKKAKNTGLLRTFSDAAAARIVSFAMSGYIAVSVIGMICLNCKAGILTGALALGTFLFYRYMSYKKFGGITGDVAGWFVQVVELICLMGAAVI